MTAANHERTGKRRVTRLSKIVRGIDDRAYPGIDMRNIDLDMTAYNSSCEHFTWFAEDKPANYGFEHWRMTRQLARSHDSYGLLVVERDDQLIDVFPWHPRKGRLDPLRKATDDQVRDYLASIHREHEC